MKKIVLLIFLFNISCKSKSNSSDLLETTIKNYNECNDLAIRLDFADYISYIDSTLYNVKESHDWQDTCKKIIKELDWRREHNYSNDTCINFQFSK